MSDIISNHLVGRLFHRYSLVYHMMGEDIIDSDGILLANKSDAQIFLTKSSSVIMPTGLSIICENYRTDLHF